MLVIKETCGKGHNNWSTWTSSSGKINRYCKSCRQERSITYTDRKNKAEGSHTREEFLEKLKRYPKCPQCERRWEDISFSKGKAKFKITEEHIVALSNGGSDSIDNIIPLCHQCNFKNGHKINKK